MDIQYLNGIDIQLLNGVYDGPLDARQKAAYARMRAHGKQQSEQRRKAILAQSKGIDNVTAHKAMAVAAGSDFAGFSGDGSEEDAEKVRTYLAHTKEVIDVMPQAVSGYGKAEQMSKMLGYVLDRWDTPEREEALDKMIEAEQQMVGLGAINTNVAEDAGERTQEDYYDVDNYLSGALKRSFLSAAKKALKAKVPTEAQDIVASNLATWKARKVARAQQKARREYGTTGAVGLMGVSDDVQMLMDGTDVEYENWVEDPMLAICRYVQRTRKVAVEQPDMFRSEQEARATAQACETLLRAWGNEALRTRVLASGEQMSGDLGKLFSKIKKALKKAGSTVAKGVTTAAKTVGKGVATAAKAVAKATKKVGKAVAKVAKKVWKIVVRFNPLTLMIRAGILAFCRLNMYKVSNKCYIGSLAKEEALKKGATAEEWEKSNKAYKHLANAYTKLGGKESKLRSTLEKGNKKKWEGTEYPTDADAIKASGNKVSVADDKEAQADSDYDEAMAEMKSKGYIADSTVSVDVPFVEKKEEVTIIENERTTTQAMPLLEEDAATSKVLVNVPRAAKVLVDLQQTSGDYIAANYEGKNGWIVRGNLAGLGACDAESVLMTGLGGIYDQYGCAGLGAVATGTAIASAAGTIASVMSKIKDVFGVAKNAIDTTKKAIDTGKQVASAVKNTGKAIKSGDVSAVIKNVSTVANSVKNVKSAVTNTSAQAPSAPVVASVLPKIANAVSPVQNIVDNIKTATQTVTNVVSPTPQPTPQPTPAPTPAPTPVQPTPTPDIDKAIKSLEEKIDKKAEPQPTTNNNNMIKYIAIGGAAIAALVGVYLIAKRK